MRTLLFLLIVALGACQPRDDEFAGALTPPDDLSIAEPMIPPPPPGPGAGLGIPAGGAMQPCPSHVSGSLAYCF